MKLTNLWVLIFFLFESCAIFQATKVPSNNLKSALEKNSLQKPKIVFLGDSITHGRVSYDYVGSISKHPTLKDYHVVNEGINSRLTVQILEQLEDLKVLNPDFVFLLIGTNDLKATLSEEEYKRYASLWNLKEPVTEESFVKNLRTIIQNIKTATKAKLVVFSPPILGEDKNSIPFQRSKRFAELTKEVVTKEKVTYKPLHETLSKGLEDSKLTNKKPYISNTWGMYWTILKYYSTPATWNDLGDSNGYHYLTDAIHLNERGGKILEPMVLEEILSNKPL
ncbi:SGNH/GDSL hydrolase family protein [Leptospira sp. 2 VSF19]|uniref:SGNH/GDSL hydrolase family protein n=1 Tax=Leptospira soteropolitanensis TaxID=2950025 RepID=A0AAW5VDQ3_9LEPT|nr:SGNH/GDSL hydrolase family protein [Leptospira soteropolitanensis]MCW7493409.1 SGNH/GDSL hydrolase family protein [Leptospira soteropolitanensis]MCW7501059.1 SGNH/GDSL hydrolase family protein [Leptospira soteropolitanensis]MCW7523261.1 SGNH/GDSL hydrolase family protein [Leptospira soteropolitanensis]MCW7527122.1 SGNH/GDSL hydrolase family protein [Leptospira soteropolitanensis]MCW7530979.1 SGNH/GDSL hydrolase family protein [Leptospira soteropolitanensis]